MKNVTFVGLFLITSITLCGQGRVKYPTGYFSSPLDTVLNLKGSFGEIRSNHFHSGIDIGTGERENMPVLAAASGYVSRIKISGSGFGKAIYITHSNGYVSVYAHLGRFNDAISDIVRNMQYQKESFEIDTLLKPKELKVKKGDVIAYSGNTGDSEGPHLHFEIRDEKSEEPINPLLFGLDIQDTFAPEIKSIRVYPKRSKGIVEMTDEPYSYPVVKSGSSYKVAIPDYMKVYGSIAFGIEVTDKSNNSDATLGVYSVTLTIDSQNVYQVKMDRINFSDTRYANAFIDYSLKVNEAQSVLRCHKLPGTKLLPVIVSMNDSLGFSDFVDEHAHKLHFEVSDFSGNMSTLELEVLSFMPFGQVNYAISPANAVIVTPSKGLAVHKSEIDIAIPAGCLYDDYYLTVEESKNDKQFYSKSFTIGDESQPLHQSITIGIKLRNEADSTNHKLVMTRNDYNGMAASIGGSMKENYFTATTKKFGTFQVQIDSVPPIISPLFDTSRDSLAGRLSFMLLDNLSGIKYYRATLNDKWLLMEFDSKTNTLWGDLPADQLLTEAKFQLVVRDERNNETVFQKTFKSN